MDQKQATGRVVDLRSGDHNFESRQMRRTKGWQLASLPDNIAAAPSESWNQLTDNSHAKTVMNVYQPGDRNEMHCHPGSEHIFYVVQGKLHVSGLNEGEDVLLTPGQFVHIKASYFYALANETDEVTVAFQVATKPAKPVKIATYEYPGPGKVDPEIADIA